MPPVVGALVPIAGSPTPLPTRPITPYEEEGNHVIRRNRELEAALKRLGSQLLRERKEHKMREVQAQKIMKELEGRHREWEQGWEAQLTRVREECERKLAIAEAQQKHAYSVEGQLAALRSSVDEQQAKLREEERQRKVELLARQSIRRMISQQLAMGFTAWQDLYEERMRKKRLMQHASMRLAKPALTAAFRFWNVDWQQKLRTDQKSASLLQETQLKGAQSVLEAKYKRMVEEYESKLKQLENEKNDAVQALRSELENAVGMTEQEALAKAKEERIEMLHRTSVRRIMRADFVWGWSCWFDFWSAKVYAMDRLRGAANKLKSPELYDAFTFWYTDAMEAKRAMLTEENASVSDKLANATQRAAQMEREIEELKAQLEETAKERDALAGGLTSLESSAAEKARLTEEQLMFEKEQRIQLLARQVGRRMMNQGIIRGWTRWSEMYEETVHQRNMLRAATNRLMKPAITAAFAHWNKDWKQALLEAERLAHAKHIEALKSASGTLEVQIALLKEEYEEKQKVLEAQLVAAEEDKVRSLERLRIELTGTLEQRLDAEKEDRIELLRKQAVRRIMMADIAWGWSAWFEMWSAKVYSMGRLRECANRLRAPGLGHAFTFWANECFRANARSDADKQMAISAQLEVEKANLVAQMEEQASRYEASLAEAAAEADHLRLTIEKLAGGVQEGEQALKAALEANHQERIEALQKRVVRRMLNADLSGAFVFWMLEAREWKKDKFRAETEGALETLRRERAELIEEVKSLKFEHERQMMGVEEQMAKALEELRIELVGTAEEQLAAQEEREREERIELMKRQAGRRILNADLTWGWNGWYDYWFAFRRLREIGARFRAPALGQAFAQWWQLCEARHRAKQLQELENASKSLEGRLRASLFEAGQLRLLRTANADEISYLKAKLREKDDQVKEFKVELAKHSPENEDFRNHEEEIEQLKVLLAEAQELAATADRKREEAEVETVEQRDANQKLLEQLVAEQRGTYERELNNLKAKLAMAHDEKENLAKDLEKASKEAKVAQGKLDKIKRDKEEKDRLAQEAKNKKHQHNFIMDDPNNPVSRQLAVALRTGGSRILDMFRQWDKDGDGTVDRAEFINAMPKFGFDLPPKEIGKLFDEWDSDGGGSLSFKELARILKKRPVSGSRPGTPGQAVSSAAATSGAASRFANRLRGNASGTGSSAERLNSPSQQRKSDGK